MLRAASGNDLVKHVAPGVFFVDMGRVHITRHDGKELDILSAQGANQARRLAQFDLIKSLVFYHVHPNSPLFFYYSSGGSMSVSPCTIKTIRSQMLVQ